MINSKIIKNDEISQGKSNTWVEVAVLVVTDTTVTTTEMLTSGLLDRSATVIKNETDTELLHIVSPAKKDSVLEETIEEKKLSSYDRTVKHIMSLILAILRL